MGLCHGCSLSGNSSIPLGYFSGRSGGILDGSILVGGEGFHASKESSSRIFSSTHVQRHQRLCSSGNAPPYVGTFAVIF